MKVSNDIIFFYDGDCGMCNSYVIFLLKSTPKGVLKFSSLQSDLKKELISETRIDSAIFYNKGKLYYESQAILYSIKYSNSLYRFLYYLKIIPSYISNIIYKIIASKRKLFSKNKSTCILLTKEEEKLFI